MVFTRKDGEFSMAMLVYRSVSKAVGNSVCFFFGFASLFLVIRALHLKPVDPRVTCSHGVPWGALPFRRSLQRKGGLDTPQSLSVCWFGFLLFVFVCSCFAFAFCWQCLRIIGWYVDEEPWENHIWIWGACLEYQYREYWPTFGWFKEQNEVRSRLIFWSLTNVYIIPVFEKCCVTHAVKCHQEQRSLMCIYKFLTE